jgi:tripartite-type tricarboxylate transporter receptor subunit TctC
MRRRAFIAGGSAAIASLLSRSAGRAQSGYPTKQIHLVVPTSAGGVHDVIGRIWADRVKSSLGTIIIENRAGGGSSIGLNYVAQQPADGHLLLVGSTSTLVLREGGNNRAYDALKDIRSAAIVATTSTSIAVAPSLPIHSVKELIAYAKANPGKLSYGSGGIGAITHITPELFKQRAGGLDILHVPYRGIAPAMNDLLGGNIGVIFPNITSQVVALHRSGKLRILAINAPERVDRAGRRARQFRVADLLRHLRGDWNSEIHPRAVERGHAGRMGRQGVPGQADRIRLRADAGLWTGPLGSIHAGRVRQVGPGGAEGSGAVSA